jgi:hypothetical protein
MDKPPRDNRKPPTPPPDPDADREFDLAAGIELQQIDHPLAELLAPPKKKPMRPIWKVLALFLWAAALALLCMTVASVINETTTLYSCRYCDLTFANHRTTVFGMTVESRQTATWQTERTFTYGQFIGIPHQHRFYSRGGSTLSNSILRVGEVTCTPPDPESKLCDYALRVTLLVAEAPEEFVTELYLEMMRGEARMTLPGVAWILRTNPESQQRATAPAVWKQWLDNRKAYRVEREGKQPPGSDPDVVPESMTPTTTLPAGR